MYEAGEMDGSPVIAGGETAEMLEAMEASLDTIALFVEFGVVQDGDLAIANCARSRPMAPIAA